MKPIIIFRHAENEGPGYIGEFLKKNKIPSKLIKIDQGEAIDQDLNHSSGLIFMGGPMSVNDDLPWIVDATSLIYDALRANIPVMGVCLGGQLMAKAMGATISRNPVPEFGWLSVDTVHTTATRAWLENVPASFNAFHWHGETFSLPEGAERILSSAACINQGFVTGKSIALQCHVEMNESLVRDWANNNNDLPPPAATIQTAAEMLDDLEEKIRSLQKVADSLFGHWINGLS